MTSKWYASIYVWSDMNSVYDIYFWFFVQVQLWSSWRLDGWLDSSYCHFLQSAIQYIYISCEDSFFDEIIFKAGSMNNPTHHITIHCMVKCGTKSGADIPVRVITDGRVVRMDPSVTWNVLPWSEGHGFEPRSFCLVLIASVKPES